MEYALQKQRQQGPAAALSVSLIFVLVAHHVLNVFSKAYDVRRSPSPALAEDSHITVRRQQNAKQTSVSLVVCLTLQDLMIHFAVGLVTRSQMNALLQPGYHIRAERNSSVVEDM